jgi:GTP-binding protein
MKYSFVKSSTEWKMCPEPDKPEVAFIGRSNVGKSSLINALLKSKDAAKTSSTPGKTQVINHFLIEKIWYMVDLPGYGYARVSRTERVKWEKMVKNYLTNRKNLVCLMVLIDSRIPPQESDLDFVRYAGKNGIPIVLVFTKADKQSMAKTKNTIQEFGNEMLKSWEELPQIIITSAQTGLGREEILEAIEQGLESFEERKEVG